MNSRRRHPARSHDPNYDHYQKHRGSQPVGFEAAKQSLYRHTGEKANGGESHDPKSARWQHSGRESAHFHAHGSGDQRCVNAETW
jgi:hypothetical protein